MRAKLLVLMSVASFSAALNLQTASAQDRAPAGELKIIEPSFAATSVRTEP
jgi:hypothetical protein